MKRAGQVVLTPFPYTDLSGTKQRPVLLLRQASEKFDDWLVCMLSSQLYQTDGFLDEAIMPVDDDFAGSGLKAPSIFRLTRLAVLNGALLLGSIGAIGDDRLIRIRQRLANWIIG